MLMLLLVGGSLWSASAYAAPPSSECPSIQITTVPSRGSAAIDNSACSVFGYSGMPTAPLHGSVANVADGTGIATYTNGGDGALSDTFVLLDDEGGTITVQVTILPPAIAITPATLVSPVIGTAYSSTLAASGGVAPYTFTITGLPPGMSASGATISGTPTGTGTFTVAAVVQDSTAPTALTATNNYTFTVLAPTITLTPSTVSGATAHVAYSQNIGAHGGTAPYTYSVTTGALPPGLTLDGTGSLSGTPTTSGSFPFTVSAADSTSNGSYHGSQAYTLTVASPTITLAPATLLAPTVGTAYTPVTITASGGVAPYSYAVTSGVLPAGLSISNAGVLSGTPTASGTANFTVTATDADADSGSRAYSLTASAPTLAVTPAAGALSATSGMAYSQNFSGGGGVAPYAFALTSGALPAGLVLKPTGVLSGTSTQSGTFSFTVTMTDSSTGTGAPFSTSANYTLTVSAPTITIAPGTLAGANDGSSYTTTQLTASGGQAPYTFAVVAGTLPAGVALSGSGALSGTPTSAGIFPFTVRATDADSFSGSMAYTLTVNAPTLALVPASLPAGTAEAGYSQTLSAIGGVAPYNYAITSGALPVGVTLNGSTGAITGTPTVAGAFNLTVRVTDSSTGVGAPFSASQSYTVNINAPGIAITPASVPNGQEAVAYSQQLAASGGNGTYTFAVTSGTLPTGVTLSTSGQLSGTPARTGSFPFTVTATDGLAFTGSLAYTLTVNAPNLALSPASLPGATAETAYTQSFSTTGGVAPYNYTISGGALPTGLTLNASTGTLSGTPTANGSFTFSVTSTDSSAGAGAPFAVTHSYTLAVGAPAITLAPTSLATAQAAVSYSQQITASGGNGTYTYALSAGSLPAGVTLSTNGLLAGTPTTAASYSFTITATDGLHFIGSQAYTIAVGQPRPVAVADSATTPANTAVTIPVTSVDTGPITSIAIGHAPAHGSASVNGLNVVYTPTGNFFGSDSLTYTATGPGGTSGSATVSITVTALAVPTVTAQSATTLAGKPVTIQAATGATGGPFTGVAIATPPASGGISINGTEIVFTPAADASGLVTFTYTLSNAFGASLPAHASVTVDPLPVAPATLSLSAVAGVPVTVDLTNGARGGPFTAAALVSVMPANAGSASISATGGSFQLHFAPGTSASGAVTISFTLSNAFATSAPGTVNIAVTPRSDPSKDPEVLGVLDAQADAARRFATAQIANFQQRLESLHQEGGGSGFTNGLSASSPSMLRQSPSQQLAALDGSGTINDTDPTRRYLVQPSSGIDNRAPATPGNGQGNGSGIAGLALWTGGAVNFGSADPNSTARGLDFTTSGVSLGADYRLSSSFAIGTGFGYGHDNTDIGNNGSRSTANSYTAAFYGSYHPSASTYIDALIGYQRLSFDSQRFVTDDGSMVTGHRNGDQVFTSLSAGYDYKHDKLQVTPYARLDLATASLDAYTEHGDAIYALDYHKQTVSTTTTSLGVHLDYQTDTGMGVLVPRVRVEYQHDFQGAGQATLSYADLAAPLYRATLNQWGQDRGLFGLGASLLTPGTWTLRAEFQEIISSGEQQTHSIMLDISKKFP